MTGNNATLLREAVERHRRGDLDGAERGYAEVLGREPGSPDALHLIGVAARQRGRPAEAVLRIAQALNRRPDLPGIHRNLDLAVADLGPPLRVADTLTRQLTDAPERHDLRLLLLHALAGEAMRSPEAADDGPAVGPGEPDGGPALSVIVCSIDPAKFARVTTNLRAVLAGTDHEIVGIHDARSLCDGYARGLAAARGDILVFCHDDIEILAPDFAARLRRHLDTFDVVGVAGTSLMVGAGWVFSGWPHQHGIVIHEVPGERRYRVEVYGASAPAVPAQTLDGVLIAGRRSAFEAVGFDAALFDGFHLYDMDFTYRAHRMGLRLAVCNDLPLVHQSSGRMDSVWAVHAARFLEKHRDSLPRLVRQGPNPLRAVWLGTRGQVRGFCRLVLERSRWVTGPAPGYPPA